MRLRPWKMAATLLKFSPRAQSFNANIGLILVAAAYLLR